MLRLEANRAWLLFAACSALLVAAFVDSAAYADRATTRKALHKRYQDDYYEEPDMFGPSQQQLQYPGNKFNYKMGNNRPMGSRHIPGFPTMPHLPLGA